MVQNIFLQEYFKIIQYLYQIKNTLNVLVALLKSNGISEENIENITKSDSNFAPTFVNHYVLPDINFNGHCLINISIPYILIPWLRNSNTDFTLNNCLFGSVKLTKNGDLDKYE